MISRAERRRLEKQGLNGVEHCSFTDRLNLLSILPKSGDIITLKIVRDLTDALSFTEEEIKVGKLRQLESGRLSFDGKVVDKLGKDVAMGEKAHELVVGTLKSLSEKRQLDIACLPLYERFVEAKKSSDGKEAA